MLIFFTALGVFVVLYYLVSLFLWCVIDSDVELAFYEKFGKPIHSMKGKVCWITGASSGIGKSLAIKLSENGVKLAISARREDELEKVKKECLSRSSSLRDEDILVVPMDLLNLECHESKFNIILNHFKTIDILVNNAGRSQRASAWESIDIKVDKELFELDLFSVVNLSRVVVKYFKEEKNGFGHVAVTSSGAGLIPVPFSPSYCGAKFALNGYFSALKLEEPNIDVSIFCPGPIATPFLEQSFTDKSGEKYGIPISPKEKRMSSERCAELFGISLANKLMNSWAALFPVPPLLYITLYYPNLRKIVTMILSKKGMKAIREGNK